MIEVQELAREFQDILQITESVAKITTKFQERSLLVPLYVADEEMKKMRDQNMPSDEIHDFMSLLG